MDSAALNISENQPISHCFDFPIVVHGNSGGCWLCVPSAHNRAVRVDNSNRETIEVQSKLKDIEWQSFHSPISNFQFSKWMKLLLLLPHWEKPFHLDCAQQWQTFEKSIDQLFQFKSELSFSAKVSIWPYIVVLVTTMWNYLPLFFGE